MLLLDALRYKAWADRDDRYPTTQPTSGHHTHWWWGRHHSGYSGRSGGWFSSGRSSVSRGGFGHIGHGVGS